MMLWVIAVVWALMVVTVAIVCRDPWIIPTNALVFGVSFCLGRMNRDDEAS